VKTQSPWHWDKEKDESSFAACATGEDFKKHIDAVNDDYFVACLDIGHAEMKGLNTTAPDMIRALGNRLKALHIHDNDLWHDSHQIPFSMRIDFEATVKALKEIHYDGEFTLEADQFLSAYTQENIFDGIKNMAECAKKLAAMFDSLTD